MMEKNDPVYDEWSQPTVPPPASTAEDAADGADDLELQADILIETFPGKKQWYGVKYRASFILDDGALLLAEKDVGHLMHVRIVGIPLDPRLQFLIPGIGFETTLAEFRAKNIGVLQVEEGTFNLGTLLNVQFLSHGGITVGLAEMN